MTVVASSILLVTTVDGRESKFLGASWRIMKEGVRVTEANAKQHYFPNFNLISIMEKRGQQHEEQ